MNIEKLPKVTKKGEPNRHWLAKYEKDGRMYYLHATKGWRSFKKRD